MLVENLGAKRNRFSCGDRTVGNNLHGQLVVITDRTNAGIIDRVTCAVNRSINRVRVNRSDGGTGYTKSRIADLLVALLRDVSAAGVEGQLHVEAIVLTNGADMMLGVEHFQIGICLDIASLDLSGTNDVDHDGLGTLGVQLCNDTLNIQNNFSNIFHNTGDGRKLMKNAVDLDAGNSNTRQRAQQNSSQGITQRRTESSFQRFYDELALLTIITQVDCCDIGLLNHSK